MTIAQPISVEKLHRALGGDIARGTNGPQVICPGPGHSNSDRSLAVSPAANGDGFIVFSHADDDVIACKDYVRKKLGLPPFQPGNGKDRTAPPNKVVARIYDYTDEAGKLLFQVVRFEPKGFAQRRPDGDGGWTWNLEGVRRVPYRLPEILEAIGSERPVFVAEGEKDVDALWQLGIPATCNPQGAGKWRDEYSEHFRGATVYVLPDNDAPGRAHAEQVAESLAKTGATIRVLHLPRLPERGDVSNWIKAGGTAEQLYGLADKAPIWSVKVENHKAAHWRNHIVTAAELQHKTFPQVTEVVPGLIVEGLTILAGKPKLGKSWAALDICIGVTDREKRPVLGGIVPAAGDALYCALEDTERRLQSRATRLLGVYGNQWPERLTLATRWRRLDDGGVDDIGEWADSVVEPRLVVLDTLAGVRPQRLSGDQLYDGDYRALMGLHRLAGDRRLAVLVLHHTRKMDADDPLDTVSGTLGLAGCADTVLVLARGGQGTTLYVRGRDLEEAERAITFDKAACRWTVMGDAEELRRSETRQKIRTLMADVRLVSEPIGAKEIGQQTGQHVETVARTLLRMVEDGEIIKVSRGLYIHPDRVDLLSLNTRPNRPNVRNG